jgi:hypothetical protein
MTRNRVNCFIAIRIGGDDTDAIYEKIVEVVSGLGMHPRRIDRLEHIENINQKIVSELNESDIAITDLTYARPSVYYEAGYAQRKIPVIYTCREDHLNSKDDTLKVHFDVDRYNIIFWHDPNDQGFIINLKSRLQFVIDNLVNIPLIEDLRGYLICLDKSSLNPENVFKRIKNLFSHLSTYPRVKRDHANHEVNIKMRQVIYQEIFETIQADLLTETASAQQNHWVEFAQILEDEVNSLESLFEQSNYGRKVFYAGYLGDIYKLYLGCMMKLYQRPSSEYQAKYDRVKSGVQKLIGDIEKPVWS